MSLSNPFRKRPSTALVTQDLVCRSSELSGTVCFFNGAAGFGLITPDRGGGDAFVHVSAINASGLTRLSRNERVRYVLRTDSRGQTCAHDLVLLDG
ncbi:CspA family cold shock protein [Stakelama sediminis]|uniref:CspA family cold shock protein n=1 Tax=Stakelama sediminis TaxID=463200 RepID=A0A840Z327_9SPHN|nr:CspA family cold shock protein [Stakelama sediminis]